ncbi:MAG: hypothetical protein HXO61_09140 [Rothia mucilaginosa]|uniref:Uncharacterized protein n=1 Tax=Rothia mucilaginosa TaxID=43675 RepID=A0A930L374_9MICC|nr:hypothetical protein [Rothia mucilaginosa]MBF1658074.1 hypothetical protein [Rothia mucilaginosa]
METTRPASMNDYQEMQNIVPVTLSIPVLKMPISPEEVRKESPETAEIRMLVIGLNRPVTPMRSFVGDGVLILAQTPAWEKARQEIYEASVAGDKGRMLEVMLTLAAEYLELQKPSDIFDFAVPISEA